MTDDLNKRLHDLRISNVLPMHMPGHKRNPLVMPYGIPMGSDITEIDGFDNLHSPEGVIRSIEQRAAALWGSRDAFISVNGATALIQSAILSSTKRGDKILVSSNCHISVWHAIELGGLIPVTVSPERSDDLPFMLGMPAKAFAKALDEHKDIKAAVITTPTYEGVISDTEKLYEIASEHECLLIVDESHGAHLGIKGQSLFPAGASGDIVIKSVHKTLNAPTQTAVMLVNGDHVNTRLIRHYLSVNESTSPSYILMAGLENALKTADTDTLYKNVDKGRQALEGLKKLKLFDGDDLDKSKFVIMTRGYMTGDQLAELLREQFLIEIEAAFPTYIIAMTGTGDTAATIARFTDAILAIDASLPEEAQDISVSVTPEITYSTKMSIEKAIKSSCGKIAIDEAAGSVSAEYLFAYPPGIPLLIPGQEITEDIVKILTGLIKNGSSLKTDPYRTWDGMLLKVDTDA